MERPSAALLGSLQVKGWDQALAYGGVDSPSVWRECVILRRYSVALPCLPVVSVSIDMPICFLSGQGDTVPCVGDICKRTG
jgi:hypothetical protein